MDEIGKHVMFQNCQLQWNFDRSGIKPVEKSRDKNQNDKTSLNYSLVFGIPVAFSILVLIAYLGVKKMKRELNLRLSPYRFGIGDLPHSNVGPGKVPNSLYLELWFSRGKIVKFNLSMSSIST